MLQAKNPPARKGISAEYSSRSKGNSFKIPRHRAFSIVPILASILRLFSIPFPRLESPAGRDVTFAQHANLMTSFTLLPRPPSRSSSHWILPRYHTLASARVSPSSENRIGAVHDRSAQHPSIFPSNIRLTGVLRLRRSRLEQVRFLSYLELPIVALPRTTFLPLSSYYIFLLATHTRGSRRRARSSSANRDCHILAPRVPAALSARACMSAHALAPRTRRRLNARPTGRFV